MSCFLGPKYGPKKGGYRSGSILGYESAATTAWIIARNPFHLGHQVFILISQKRCSNTVELNTHVTAE